MVFTFPENSFLQCLNLGCAPLEQPLEKLPEMAESIHALKKKNRSGFSSFPKLGSRALGNHLDRLFRSMTPDILDEASLSFTPV
ncbi:MAG: hypothetical protein AAGC54_09185, partial [Cyanobacteria bacterium P01_F01_bin.4]